MFVTAVRIPSFNPERSKQIISTLGEIHGRMKGALVPGFQRTLLLRKADESAILMTFWRTRLDLEKFIASSVGTQLSEAMAGMMKGTELEEYQTAWEASADEEPSPQRIPA